jgi:gliding motility-associated-like protein
MKMRSKNWLVVILVAAMSSFLHYPLFSQTSFKFPSFKNERIQSMDEIWVQVSGKLALCSHSERGTINLTVGGGKPPYSFKWNTNESTQNRTNLNAGTYTVWVTDSEGRVRQERIVIQPPFPLVLNPVVKKDATCGSGNDGYAKISVKIGRNDYDPAKPPYKISWSNGLQDVWEVNNLTPGTYVVKVADKFNCETSISFEIKAAATAITASGTVENPTCESPNSGKISLNVQGGQPPLTYLWSNGAITKDLSGLSAGNYQVRITDSKGCIIQSSFAVTSPQAVQLDSKMTQPSCEGSLSGEIEVQTSGGKAPFTYLWNTGQITSKLSGLGAGTYSVRVTDASGCTAEKQFVLSYQSSLKIASSTKQDVTCFGSAVGKIDLVLSGASGAIQVAWSDGSTALNRTNLAPGSYSVSIKDQFCEISSTYQIVGPSAALSTSASIQNPTCAGNDGRINLNPQGGTAPYSYRWSNGLLTKDVSGLGPGRYQVDITDKNGCTFQASYDLASPLPISLELDIREPSCQGKSDGMLALKVTGGNAPYTFLWSNGATQNSIQNLAAGTYKVKITDNTGCSVEKEYILTNQSQLTVSVLNLQPVSCSGGNDGKIVLGITGAKGAFKIKWEDDNSSSLERTNLKAGTYTVLISDESNCQVTNRIQVEEVQELQARIETSLNVDCTVGTVTGLAWVAIQGGKEPYSISWNTGPTADTREINFFTSGILKVTIQDALGCKVVTEAKVDFPNQSTEGSRIDFQYRKLTITNDPEVMVQEEIIFESEIAPEFIAWEWEFGDGFKSTEKNPVHVFEKPGQYEVKLTGIDKFGCNTVETNEVLVNSQEEMMVIPNAFSPNDDGLNDTFKPKMRGITEYNVQVFNNWGEKIFFATGVESEGWDGTYKGQKLPAGNYIYRIDYVNWEGVQKTTSGSLILIR